MLLWSAPVSLTPAEQDVGCDAAVVGEQRQVYQAEQVEALHGDPGIVGHCEVLSETGHHLAHPALRYKRRIFG